MLANTSGQDLKLHNKAVGVVAKAIATHVTKNMTDAKTQKAIVEQTCLAGYLHDVGKADPAFQNFLKKKTKSIEDNDELEEDQANKNWLFHNQNSWLALSQLPNAFERNMQIAAYAIYHHHTPSRNKPDFDKNQSVHTHVSDFCELMYQEFISDWGAVSVFGIQNNNSTCEPTVDFPEFVIAQMCLIQADRWVSAIGSSLNNITLDNQGLFCVELQQYLVESTRLNANSNASSGLYGYQQNIVDLISKSNQNTFVVEGAAGCGKTAIAIGFCELFSRKNDLYVAPRNTICHSLFDTIGEDLKLFALNRTVELVTASTRQKATDCSVAEQNSDVVIINIDSVLNSYFNHAKTNNLISYLTQPMVIDEFHELLKKEPLFAVARSLIVARDLLGAKTLLISATPVNLLQGLAIRPSTVRPMTFDTFCVPYPAQIDTVHDFEVVSSVPDELEPETWVRLNTISATQDEFTGHKKDGLILHSKYSVEDRAEKFDICNAMYSKNPTDENKCNVFSSPINECSLNNSYEHGVFEVSTPYSLIQSLGRIRRFAGKQHSIPSKIKLVINDSASTAAYIRLVYHKDLFDKWKLFVQQNFHGKSLKKSEVVELVKQFELQTSKDNDLWVNQLIKDSRSNVKNIRYKMSSSGGKTGNVMLANGTLRGNAGAWGIWESNGTQKLFSFSDEEISFIVDQMNKKYGGAGEYYKQISNLNCAYVPLFPPSHRFSEYSLVKKARSNKTPIIMEFNGFASWCFFYDKSLDVRKNLGISKFSNEEFVDDEV